MTRWITAMLGFLLVAIAGGAAYGQYPDCGFGCSANDVNVVEAYVDAPETCVPGDLLTAGLYVTFLNGTNSNRYAVRLLGELYVGGRFEQSLDECVIDTMPPGSTTVLLSTVSWTCGESLEFLIVTVSWSANRETCGDTPSCAERKAKCWFAPVIAIEELPVSVDFTSTAPVCHGETVHFTDLTNGGDTPYSYEWDFGDGGSSRLPNPSYTYSGPGTYVVTITVTDSRGITNSTSSVVTVDPNPDATATSGGPYCLGDTIELSASGGVIYSWTGPNGFSSSLQNPPIPNASAANAGAYTVVVSNVYGCTDQASTLVEMDATSPILTRPSDATVECGDSTEPAQTGQATATDDTDPASTVTYSDVSDLSGCGETGAITRTWTATDACGNTASGTQTITVVDTTTPVLQISSASFECDGAGNVTDVSDWLSSAVATDTCGAVTVTNDYAGLTETCPGVGSASVTFTATDACGNVTTRMATLTIADTTPPGAIDDAATTDEGVDILIDVLANDSDVCDPAVALVAAGSPAFGTTEIVAGQVRYTPPAGFDGSDSFSYTIEDCSGNAASTLVEVTVLPVNDPPAANDQTATAQEDTPLPLTVTATDPDGDMLTYSIVGGPSNGTISGFDPATGQLTYTPDANYDGPDSFTFEACDPSGACDTGVVTITVEPVDDPPAADPQTLTTPEDTPLPITVTGSDADVGDPITYGIVSGPSNGTISGFDPATGDLVYTPDANFTGTDSFVFETCDPHAWHGCAQATVTITVTPVNDPPAANDDATSTLEDTSVVIGVAANDFDVDGNLDPTTVTVLASPANGTVVVDPATGDVTYRPDPDFNGTDTFSYEICDTGGLCDTATATVTVVSEGDPPVAEDDGATTPEDQSVVIGVLANDTDVDNDLDPASVTIVTPPANGTTSVNPVTGEVTYTPDSDFNGPDVFTYQVCDADSVCDTAAVQVNVTPVNDPPAANDQTATAQEDTPLPFTVTATDPDGDVLTYSILSGPSNGTISGFDPATGELTYTPDADYDGPDSFTFEACDPSGACDTGAVTIAVEAIDDPPAADPQTLTTPEDTPLPITVTGSDADVGDPITYGIASGPSNGTISGFDPATGDLIYTPNANYTGTDSFVFETCDPHTWHGCAQATVTIIVTAVNDPPLAQDQIRTTAEDTATGFFALLISDPDNTLAELSCDCQVPPSHGTVVRGPDHTVNYTPDPDFNGIDTFSYVVCDPEGLCDTASVTVNVTPVGDPPVAGDDTATVAEDGSVVIDVPGNDSDVDGDLDLTSVTVIAQPPNGTVTVDPVTGEVTYTPDPDFNGTDTFSYEICDSVGVCDTAVVTVNVTPVDDPPVALDDTANVAEDGAVVIDVPNNDSDPDGDLDITTVSIVSLPATGTVTVNPATGAISYEPDPDFNGQDTFSYEICDSVGVCDTATVTVNVIPANDPPIANDDTTSTAEDAAVVVNVVGNDFDVDGNLDPTTVEITSSPSNGIVSVNPVTGEVTYTPAADFFGLDSFSYQVCDTDGLCDVATVTVNVGPTDDPPVALDDTGTVPEDGVTTIDVVSNDSDPDGNLDPGSVLVVSPPAHGDVTVDPITGAITYAPDENYNGPDTLTYQVCDDDGECDLAVVTLTVTPVDDPPVAGDDTATVAEDGAVVIGVPNNDSDPDGDLDITTVSIVSPPANGTVSVDPITGAMSYEPDPDFNGTDTFSYEICDSIGVCDTASVTVNVTPIDDPPVALDDTANVAEDGNVVIGVPGNDSDPDGDLDVTSVSIVSSPSNGTVLVDPITGEISYEPDPDFNGTDTFSYEICDSVGVCDTAVVTVNVTPVDDPPVALDDTANVAEDGAVVIDVPNNDSDPDGDLDITTVSIVSLPATGTVTVNPATGAISYEPDPDFNGQDTFSYEICDSVGVCDTATVTVNVIPANDPPIANDDTTSTAEDAAVVVNVVGNDFDVDGNLDPTTVEITSSPSNGIVSVNPVTGEVTYTPAADFFGLDSFSYQVCDTDGLCDVATVTVNVGPTDDPPVALDDTGTVPEDGVTTIDVVSNDSDPDGNLDPGSVLVVSPPAHGDVTVDPITGAITYAPDENYNGPDTLTYQVCDDDGECDLAVVTLTVTPVDDPPVAGDDTATVAEDGAVVIGVPNNDSDPDGDLDITTVSIVSPPANGTVSVDPITGAISYEPDPDFNGTDTFSYEICDSIGVCDTASVTVNVTPIDDPPVALDDTANVAEDGNVVIGVPGNDSDPDGDLDVTSVSIVSSPSNGTVLVDPITGEISYEPDPDFNGTDTFSYEICDSVGVCDTAVVTVNVTPVDDPPVAACIDAVVVDSVVTPLRLRGTDPDGGPVTYRIVEGPTHGTIAGFNEQDGSFYYLSRACQEEAVAINVGEETQPGFVNTLPGAAVSISVAGGDPALTTVVVPPENGTVEVNPLVGAIVYAPDDGFTGTDGLAYVGCSGDEPAFAGPVTIVYEVVDSAGATDQCVIQLFVLASAGAGGVGECEQRVIISEIAWSGTDASPDHEWIELRNLEPEPVDLAGWTLRWRRKLPPTDEEGLWRAIPLSGVVAPYQTDTGVEFRPDADQPGEWWVFWEPGWQDGYFLIERETDEAVLHVPADLIYEEELPLDRIADLDDRGDVIELVDPTGCVVDTANADDPERDGWAAGALWPTATMERTDLLESDLDENWHTNLGLVRTEMDAWGNLIHGTPKHENSPILGDAVAAYGFQPVRQPMGEPIVLRFDPLPEWPTDVALWRVLVTRQPMDEVLETDWTINVSEAGDILVEVAVNWLPLNEEIHVWVRTPSGDLLFAPFELYPY